MLELLQQLDPAAFSNVTIRLSGGILEIGIAHDDLEYALLRIASAAVDERGIEIKSVRLHFEEDTAASLRFTASITAKKALFTAPLRITGRVFIDAHLNAGVADLECKGDGIIGDLAAVVVRPELEKYEGRTVSLSKLPAFPVPLEITGATLHAGPPVALRATVRKA